MSSILQVTIKLSKMLNLSLKYPLKDKPTILMIISRANMMVKIMFKMLKMSFSFIDMGYLSKLRTIVFKTIAN